MKMKVIKEVESQEYLCPMSINRHCEGSSCMAWKWKRIDVTPVTFPPTKSTPEFSDTKGYCGMVR